MLLEKMKDVPTNSNFTIGIQGTVTLPEDHSQDIISAKENYVLMPRKQVIHTDSNPSQSVIPTDFYTQQPSKMLKGNQVPTSKYVDPYFNSKLVNVKAYLQSKGNEHSNGNPRKEIQE